MHKATGRYWRCYRQLPERCRRPLTRPSHSCVRIPTPSLHFKPIGKSWSVRVGVAYRAIAVPDGEDYIWVWIGLHDEYDAWFGTADRRPAQRLQSANRPLVAKTTAKVRECCIPVSRSSARDSGFASARPSLESWYP